METVQEVWLLLESHYLVLSLRCVLFPSPLFGVDFLFGVLAFSPFFVCYAEPFCMCCFRLSGFALFMPVCPFCVCRSHLSGSCLRAPLLFFWFFVGGPSFVPLVVLPF